MKTENVVIVPKNIMIMHNILVRKECNNKQCLNKNKKLRKCKKCLSVFYCSRLCQKRDWIKTHKYECKKI